MCILARILPRSQFLVVATIAFNTHITKAIFLRLQMSSAWFVELKYNLTKHWLNTSTFPLQTSENAILYSL